MTRGRRVIESLDDDIITAGAPAGWGAEALSSAIFLSLTRLVLGDLGLTPNQA